MHAHDIPFHLYEYLSILIYYLCSCDKVVHVFAESQLDQPYFYVAQNSKTEHPCDWGSTCAANGDTLIPLLIKPTKVVLIQTLWKGWSIVSICVQRNT